jgi:hypothetical protein
MSHATKRAGTLSRRDVIVAAGAAAVAVYLPFADGAAAPAVGAPQPADLAADWSIDDQWGVYPRYDAIPCTPHHADDAFRVAAADPVDRAFVA